MRMATKELLALKRAVTKAGGQSALARACGVKQGHIWHWLNKSLRVPAEHALAVERATRGAVTRYELRPDLFGKISSLKEGSKDEDTLSLSDAAVAPRIRTGASIAEQIAALEARQHRAVREMLLHHKGAAERLAQIDRAIASLRALDTSIHSKSRRA